MPTSEQKLIKLYQEITGSTEGNARSVIIYLDVLMHHDDSVHFLNVPPIHTHPVEHAGESDPEPESAKDERLEMADSCPATV